MSPPSHTLQSPVSCKHTVTHTTIHTPHNTVTTAGHTDTPPPAQSPPHGYTVTYPRGVYPHGQALHSHHRVTLTHHHTACPSTGHTHNHVVFTQLAAGTRITTHSPQAFRTAAPPQHPPLLKASLIKHIQPLCWLREQHSSAIESKTSPDRGAKWKKGIRRENARGPGLGRGLAASRLGRQPSVLSLILTLVA